MTVTIKEEKEIYESMCRIADAGRITIRDLGRAFARIAKLTVATDEEVSAWKERMGIN